MSLLEQRFFAEPGKTVVNTSDKNAPALCEVLKKAIRRGDFVQRGGTSTKYDFCFDAIYG